MTNEKLTFDSIKYFRSNLRELENYIETVEEFKNAEKNSHLKKLYDDLIIKLNIAKDVFKAHFVTIYSDIEL